MSETRPEIRYRSLPVRDDHPRSLALVAIVLGVSAGIAVMFEMAAWGAFAFFVLFLALHRYVIPTEYALDSDGVSVRYLGRETRRRWADVGALYPHADGVHLAPFKQPSALDPFRGIWIRFAGNRDEVLRFCESHVSQASHAPAAA